MSQIRTHRERVKAAKAIIQTRGLNLGVFDREAFVEFLLLEDILKDYQVRLLKAKKDVETAGSPIATRVSQSNVRIFAAIVKAFDALIQVTKGLIEQGQYTAVWSAIPESKLASIAKTPKKFGRLAELAAIILKRIGRDAITYSQNSQAIDNAIEDFDINDANANKIYELPSLSDLDEIVAEIAEIERSISATKKPRPKI